MTRPGLTACALLLSALSAGAASTAHADSLEEIFARANTAYFGGDFDAAAESYGELVELGVVDADVAFNLATSEARRGRYGAAVQHYERALWLRPGDDDAAAGLEEARGALARRRARQQGEAEVDSGPPLAEAVFGGVSRDALAIGVVVFELVLFGALFGLLFVRRESARLLLGIVAPLSGIVFLVCGVGLALRSGWLEEGPPAIVLAEGAPLREGPSRVADERHRALEGQRAWVLGAEDGFSLVRVPGLGEGWIADEQLGLVRPPNQ